MNVIQGEFSREQGRRGLAPVVPQTKDDLGARNFPAGIETGNWPAIVSCVALSLPVTVLPYQSFIVFIFPLISDELPSWNVISRGRTWPLCLFFPSQSSKLAVGGLTPPAWLCWVLAAREHVQGWATGTEVACDFLECHLASLLFSFLIFCGLRYKPEDRQTKSSALPFLSLPFGSYLASQT